MVVELELREAGALTLLVCTNHSSPTMYSLARIFSTTKTNVHVVDSEFVLANESYVATFYWSIQVCVLYVSTKIYGYLPVQRQACNGELGPVMRERIRAGIFVSLDNRGTNRLRIMILSYTMTAPIPPPLELPACARILLSLGPPACHPPASPSTTCP